MEASPFIEPPRLHVPDYAGWSLLAFFLMGFFTGIPALRHSLLVNVSLREGELQAAVFHSQKARRWCWISLGLWLLLWGGVLNFLVQYISPIRASLSP